MKKHSVLMSLFMCLSMALIGCQSTENLFYWGDYEALIHESYTSPGDIPPSLQIERLESIIVQAQTNNLLPAPGIYAQLGVIAVENGQKALAIQSFEKEAELYPESKAFMQYLLNTLSASETH